MIELSEGLIYSKEMNKIFFSNEYIVDSGLNIQDVQDKLGKYSEYISDDDRDLLYAKSIGIKIFNDQINSFDFSLIKTVDIDQEIIKLKEKFENFKKEIEDEFKYIKQNNHNILLLKMAIIFKRDLDDMNVNVFIMRGSGASSFLLYCIGLNRVNPLLYNLDYKDFWIN